MENILTILVWVIAIAIYFLPMPLLYQIIGIIISVILIALYLIIANRNRSLSKISLVINLLVIGWDLAVVYFALAKR